MGVELQKESQPVVSVGDGGGRDDPRYALYLEHVSRDVEALTPAVVRSHGSSPSLVSSDSRPHSSTPAMILHDITVGIPAGQVTCIVGPSGAGKSSLLRLLNRLDPPTDGTVYWRRRPLDAYPVREVRRKIGMLFQFPQLFEGSVADNVLFGPRLAGVLNPAARTPGGSPGPDASAFVTQLLAMVGLPADMAGRSTEKLSGGEAARVALARALANHPEVLLLDEPTASLDVAARHEIEELVARLQKETGLTVAWVSHDLQQAGRVADLVLVIEHGELTACGRPELILPAFETQLEANRR